MTAAWAGVETRREAAVPERTAKAAKREKLFIEGMGWSSNKQKL
jgi:hypothetical protein